MMIILKNLPTEHPLRNAPLIQIGAKYKADDAKTWCEVTSKYGIARNTYNQLGTVWTNNQTFIATKTLERDEN